MSRPRESIPARQPAPDPAVADDTLHGTCTAAARAFLDAATSPTRARGLQDAVPGLLAAAEALVNAGAGLDGCLRRLAANDAGADPLVAHSVNVAVLGVAVADEIGIRTDRRRTVCLAALLHDVGAVSRGDPGRHDWHLDDPRQLSHAALEVADDLGDDWDVVGEIASMVYERADGSGRPRGVVGDELPLEARILGAVDLYECCVNGRPCQPGSGPPSTDGVARLVRAPDKFGTDVIKALIRAVGLFPLGSFVRLSSGEIARVTEVRRRSPMRPSVEVVARGGAPGRRLELAQEPHVYVRSRLTSEELRALDLGDGASAPPPPLPG